MSNYTIRQYESDDIPEIIELLDLVFSPWPHLDLSKTLRDHWKWKHVDCPNGPSFIVVGEHDNQIVCCAHTTFRRVSINSKPYTEVCGQDLAVHPDHRGKRLSSKMSDYKYQAQEIRKTDFSSSISNVPRVISRSIKQDRLRLPASIEYHIRILDPDLHFKHQKNISPVKRIGYKIVSALTRGQLSKPDTGEHHIKTINKFDERYTLFWKNIEHDHSFIYERSTNYLNWRYCDERGGAYTIKTLEDPSGELLGYVVLRINRYDENYPQGYIVEIAAKGGKSLFFNILLSLAVQYFDEAGLNASYLWSQPGSVLNSLATKTGYLNTRFEPVIYLRPISLRNIQDVLPSRKYLIQMGDTDWI